MAVVILVVALLIVLATLVFAIANGVPVTVNLVFGQIPTQLSLAILVPFVAGLLVGVLVMVPGSIKSSLTAASHKRRLSALEKNSASKESKAAGEPPEK